MTCVKLVPSIARQIITGIYLYLFASIYEYVLFYGVLLYDEHEQWVKYVLSTIYISLDGIINSRTAKGTFSCWRHVYLY